MPLRATFGALGARALGKATVVAAPGQQSWENATGNWTVPEGVESICAVAVGKGGTYNYGSGYGAPGGGALSYSNNIPVTPGEVLTYSCTGDAYLRRGLNDYLILAKAGSNSNGDNGGAGGAATTIFTPAA